jgi:hypothetical protein
MPTMTIPAQESFLPGISNQLVFGGIVTALILYAIYYVRPLSCLPSKANRSLSSQLQPTSPS